MTRTQLARLQGRFLDAFRRHGNITQACAEAGVKSRRSVYNWKDDPVFLVAFQDADEEATEHLEAEAHRRAVDGLRRLKFNKDGDALLDPETGKWYVERHYSDALLSMLLRARAPEKYKERSATEHSAPGGGPIQQEVTLSAAALRALEAISLAEHGLPVPAGGATPEPAVLGHGAGDDHPSDQGAPAVPAVPLSGAAAARR